MFDINETYLDTKIIDRRWILRKGHIGLTGKIGWILFCRCFGEGQKSWDTWMRDFGSFENARKWINEGRTANWWP